MALAPNGPMGGSSPLNSDQFGRYRIEGELGRGAVATVYAAQSATGGALALKVLHREVAGNSKIRNAFLHEYRMLTRLRHRNIIRVYETGEINGRYYIAMDLVQGETLAEFLHRNRKFGEQATLAITRQLASALAYLHAERMVHRDVKPSNVLMTRDARAILFDFGAVLEMGQAGEDRGIYGTPAYLPPEQILAVPDLDGRADLYALGVTMYQMLVGRRPFQGSRQELLEAHLHEPPPAPTQFGHVTPELEMIVLKLLEKERDDRYADAAALIDALDTVVPESQGVGSRLRRWLGTE